MSEQAVQLRKVVAEFFSVDEARVVPGFALSGPRGSSSVTRAALDAAIRRRVGVRSPLVYTATTFGELAAGLGDPPAAASAVEPGPAPAPQEGPEVPALPIACGVDMELVENLPAAADCWTDPFYLATFTPAEIAYCLVQPAPALHFCARWCAKEALKKCDPAVRSAELRDLEVAHDAAGAPYMVLRSGGAARRLPHAVSLSHTPTAAVAVVIRSAEMPPAPTRPTPPTRAEGEAPGPPAPAGRPGVVWPLLTLAALGLSALALYRTFGIGS